MTAATATLPKRAHGWRALAASLIAFLCSAFPFVGFLGLITTAFAVRARSRAAMFLSAASVFMAIGWCIVLALPAKPVVRASGPSLFRVDPSSSSDDEQHDRLEASLVAGSLFPWTQRRDVVRLSSSSLHAVDGTYRLRLQSDVHATTHVNSVALWIVDHDARVEILSTPQGRLVAINAADVIAAARAVDGSGSRLREFSRPSSTALEAFLIVTGRSTRFAEEAFFRYVATMGRGIGPFMQLAVKGDCESSHCAREVMADEMDRLGLPLRVSVLSSSGAVTTTTSIAPIGDATRRFAVPITLPNDARDHVTIRLEMTPRFWEVDEIALAPDLGSDVEPRVISPRDPVRAAIAPAQHHDLQLDAPPLSSSSSKRTAFLALHGYYDVPLGGRLLIHPTNVLAHRWGLTSLPRFASRF